MKYNLTDPKDIQQFSETLRQFVEDNKLSMTFRGERYVLTDGWKFAGINFGLTAIVSNPVKEQSTVQLQVFHGKKKAKDGTEYEGPVVVTYLEVDKMKELFGESKRTFPLFKYQCSCEVKDIETGTVMSSGFAMCSNEELPKCYWDEYAVLSMAQTRAISKAYRNLLGFVMKAAGFSDTPAEEIDERYVSDPADGKFDQSIRDEINRCKTIEELNEYVSECSALWTNEEFKKEVELKKSQL